MQKVYACDDDSVILMMIRKILGKRYEVKTAQNIEGLTALLEEDKADLVLLDYQMPECDGLEALKILKDKGFFPAVPVVIITGEKDTALEIKCLNEGVEDFIQKPFVPDILLTRVAMAIDNSMA